MREPALVERNLDPSLSPWCNSVWKRLLDLFWAVLLLIVFSPLMLILSVAVKLTSKGAVLFRQERPGKDRRKFTILKFRTMFSTPHEPGPVLTRALDPRVTWLGRYMRRWKLDELPQLFNVLRGQMSFVGPRPQPTKLWNEPSIREDAAIVLSVRPGITSQATLIFRNEEEVLAPLSVDEVEQVYLRTLMPVKLKIEIDYLRNATFLTDMQIVLRTMGRVLRRRHDADDHLKQYLPAINASGNGHNDSWPLPASSWPSLSNLQDASTIAKRTASADESTRM